MARTKSFEWPEEQCKLCGWSSTWEVASCKTGSGQEVFFFMCNCGYRSPKFIPKSVIEKQRIAFRRVSSSTEMKVCAVCKAEGAEEHHWAPWFIFGEESEKWPKSFLCPSCHSRWHRLVTPNMGKA